MQPIAPPMQQGLTPPPSSNRNPGPAADPQVILGIDGLRELKAAQQERNADGGWPDLGDLAKRFGLTRRETNVCLDALIGRSPEEAFCALVRRFGRAETDPAPGRLPPRRTALGRFVDQLFGGRA